VTRRDQRGGGWTRRLVSSARTTARPSSSTGSSKREPTPTHEESRPALLEVAGGADSPRAEMVRLAETASSGRGSPSTGRGPPSRTTGGYISALAPEPARPDSEGPLKTCSYPGTSVGACRSNKRRCPVTTTRPSFPRARRDLVPAIESTTTSRRPARHLGNSDRVAGSSATPSTHRPNSNGSDLELRRGIATTADSASNPPRDRRDAADRRREDQNHPRLILPSRGRSPEAPPTHFRGTVCSCALPWPTGRPQTGRRTSRRSRSTPPPEERCAWRA